MSVRLARSRNVKLIGSALLICATSLLTSFSPAAASTASARTHHLTARPRVLAHGRWPKPRRLDKAPGSLVPIAPQAGKARLATTSAYKTAVLRDTPVAYWRLDELKGPTAADSSGHNLAATYGAIGGFQRTGALVGDPDTGILAATSQAITAPASTLPAAANARTIEFWGSTTNCCGSLGASYGNLAAGNGFSATYNAGNGQLTVSDGNSSDNVTVGQPYSLNDGQWHLFDFTFHSSVVIIYVDGVAVGTGTLAGLATDTSGNLTAGSPDYLDEVAVYPAALSAARVAAHWTAGSSTAGACAATPAGPYPTAVRADAPAAYYRAGDIVTNPTGRVAYDSSGHCGNGSLRYTDTAANGAIVGDSDAATAGGFSAPAAGLPAGATARTVEFWAATTNCCASLGVSYGNLAAGNGFSVTYNGGSGQLALSDGSSRQITVNQPYQLNDGNWHLFDLVYTGTQAIFYVDGVAIGTGTFSGIATHITVGLMASAPFLDEVAVYPTALSAARVAAHWTAGSSTAGACAATPAGSYPSAVLADAPTSYYRAGDIATNAKGRVAYDSSGHCNNGSLRYTDTAASGAIVGDSDAATAGGFSATAASLPAGGSARTVEFWAATTNCCASLGVSYGNLAAGNGFSVTYNAGSGQLALSDGSSLGQITINQPYQLNDGNWHLFDLVYTGTQAIFYVDGAAVGTGSLGGLTTDTSIGLTAAAPFLDEVAVYPTALSAARVAAHWNASGH